MLKQKVLDIAHRGASGIKPENTRSSFLEALRLKADVIEFDIHRTKDNEFVVIHDSSVNRTSNGAGKVTTLTLQQLKELNFGTNKHSETILTLPEALNLIGNRCNIIVELKGSIKGYEKQVLQEIEKAKNKKFIWIHSSHLPILKRIRELNPSIKLGYIIIFSYFHDILLPYYNRIIKKYKLSFFAVDELFGNKIFVKSFIKELQNRNVEVYVWTVNDFSTMHQFINWGVNGIISNYPGLLKTAIKESIQDEPKVIVS